MVKSLELEYTANVITRGIISGTYLGRKFTYQYLSEKLSSDKTYLQKGSTKAVVWTSVVLAVGRMEDVKVHASSWNLASCETIPGRCSIGRKTKILGLAIIQDALL